MDLGHGAAIHYSRAPHKENNKTDLQKSSHSLNTRKITGGGAAGGQEEECRRLLILLAACHSANYQILNTAPIKTTRKERGVQGE